MIGRKLAHYTITGKLGEGGMGVVYEALDTRLNRSVALKLLPPEMVANPSRKQRFELEAKAASALNHPNIVVIYDIGSADGVDFIAMELIRGTTLEQTLARGPLRLSEALKYGVQIADAFAAAHAAKIVHRDLKPGNIMINERGDVKVLDFGLAKLTGATGLSEDDETQTQRAVTAEGSVMGSAPYMSPEQAEGRPVDARSDIFSFGSVLYEMLSGRRAFQGPSRTATLAAILKDEPAPIPEIPRDVERIVTRCLRKELDRRSQSMAEIRVALQDLKEESESGAPAVQLTPPKRRTRQIYFAATAVLAASLGGYWFLGHRPAVLKPAVLTSFVGKHGKPSISPDGNQFAFQWDGDVPNGNEHIYISLTSQGTPLRLTPEDSIDRSPSWSPDGQSIAFMHGGGRTTGFELRVMSALGGPSRVLATGLHSGRPTWSRDGKWLIVSKRELEAARLIAVRTDGAGEQVPSTFTSSGATAEGTLDRDISPDGTRLAVVRCLANYDCDVYVVPFNDGRLTGSARRVTHSQATKISPIWSNQGKEIVFIEENDDQYATYRVPAEGGEQVRIDAIGAYVNMLTLARNGSRLLYSTHQWDEDIRRVDRTAPDPKPERFLSSTRTDLEPEYSPDGRRIAFSSSRGGIRQIWVADADGSNAAPVTAFPRGTAGWPHWSPDGKQIAFDARPTGNSSIYVVPASGGSPARLGNYAGSDHIPSWSPDGNWIYFGSDRAGGHEVFRMRPDGTAAQQLTHDGGFLGMVSPDGISLYYSIPSKGLWKMPAEGGKAALVSDPKEGSNSYGFRVVREGILTTWRGGAAETWRLALLPFAGGEPVTLFNVSGASPRHQSDLSPDGHWLLYASANPPVDGIMLVDNFR